MKAKTTHGWNTLQEGTEHYLYRSVSTLSFAKLEALVQRLRDCQNPYIAIPEIVRLANGEVYLKEPRGIRSVEDFLGTSPSTRAKLFVVQQLLKLLENLHSFVGTAHGDLHIGCLSIGLDDKLILGGISPDNVEITGDIDSLKQLFVHFFSQPTEIEVLKSLKGSSLKKMRRAIKGLLAEDAWDDIQSDWSTAIQQTSIEESSEDLNGVGQHHLAETDTNNGNDPFDFDDLDQTLDLGNPLEDLDGMPEPQNISAKQELETLDALFDEFDDLDALDVFGDELSPQTGDIEALPSPMNLQEEAPLAGASEKESVGDEWSDVDLDVWLDEVPEPAKVHEVQSSTRLQSDSVDASEVSANATVTPDLFSEGFEEDWFSTNEDTMPLNREMDLTSLEADQQTGADLEEISDFDDEDDVTELFAISQGPNSHRLTSQGAELDIQAPPPGAAQVELTSRDDNHNSQPVDNSETDSSTLDDVDWFNNTDTADFMLSDFELDELSTEASLQSVNEIDEFSIEDDDFDLDDLLPNEAEVQAASQISVDLEANENLVATDIFSRSSILEDIDHDEGDSEAGFAAEQQIYGDDGADITDSATNETLNVSKSETVQDLDDWFGPSNDTSSTSSTSLETATSESQTDEQSISKWMLVAGAVVVAGGAWATTQTRKVDTPSVRIDETQTKKSPAQAENPEAVAATETKEQTAEQADSVDNDNVSTAKTTAVSANETPAVNTAVNNTAPTGRSPKTVVKKAKTTKAKKSAQSTTPFAKAKTSKPVQKTPKTTVQTLPTPKKSAKVVAKPESNVTAPMAPAVDSVDTTPAKSQTEQTDSAQTTVTPDAIAASLTQMVNQNPKKQPSEKPDEAATANTLETVKTQPNEKSTQANPWVTEEVDTTVTPDTPGPNTEADSVTEAVTDVSSEASTPIVDDNQAVEIEQTVSESVVAEVNATERVLEDVVEAPTPKLASSTLSQMSQDAVSGNLSDKALETLQKVASSDDTFTRANAIVLTHAQQSNSPELIESSLTKILSVDENTHKPIYLLAMAQYQFNQQNLDGTREYLMQAEMNWANVERTQLSVLRAQRDNIVAHLSYISFLESGSEDSRLQSLTQFRKVQREARRARLQSLFEQAESKMQKLQRKR